MSNKILLNSEEVNKSITRISHEILEKNKDSKQIALIGIRTGGALLASRLQARMKEITKQEIPLGLLDITLYRDDLSEVGPQPDVRETSIKFDVTGKIIILVDDVLFTGRTIRCALDAIIDFGRPECIQLAVLIDRGHRELPIKADYVGKNIPTSKQEEVVVNLNENSGKEEVTVRNREAKS